MVYCESFVNESVCFSCVENKSKVGVTEDLQKVSHLDLIFTSNMENNVDLNGKEI